MALAKALDVCFGDAYIPHVNHLVFQYAFDVELSDDYGGLPYDTYRQLTQNITDRYVNIYGVIDYRVNDKLHRLDGPAKIFPDGGHIYYKHGMWHRTDGPAYVMALTSGTFYYSYYINGKCVSSDRHYSHNAIEYNP